MSPRCSRRAPGRAAAVVATAAAWLASSAALVITATDAPPSEGDTGAASVREVTLRVAASPGNAFAGESMTASCRKLPFIRAHHGEYVRFWHPHELDSADAGMQLRWFNIRERAYADIWDAVLRPGRYDPAAGGWYVVDVGANTGWYSSWSGARGYAVVGVDMQPECVRRARCAALMNRVEHLVELHTAFVAAGHPPAPLAATGGACFSGTSTNWRASVPWEGPTEPVQPLHLGRLLAHRHAATGARVALAKIDIEGGEVPAMQSLAEAGALPLIEHMIVEYSPHMWADINVTRREGLAAFAPVFAAGFVGVDVPELRILHDPTAWAAHPDTGPGMPRPGSGRGDRVLRDMDDLVAYTDGVLDTVAAQFAVFTLWFFRPPGLQPLPTAAAANSTAPA